MPILSKNKRVRVGIKKNRQDNKNILKNVGNSDMCDILNRKVSTTKYNYI